MVIDADGHVTEPENLFERYMDATMRNWMPRTVAIDDATYWLVEGKLMPRPSGRGVGTSNGFIMSGRRKPAGMKAQSGAMDDVAGRLEDMDARNIDLQIIYPTTLLGACFVENKELAGAMCRCYNNYLAEHCAKAPDRLKGVAAVPLQDPDEAVRELRRTVQELGFVGAVIPGIVGDKNLDDPVFFPFFEEADRLNTMVGLHAVTGAYNTPGQERFQNFFYTHVVAMPFNVMIGVMTVVGGGLLERLQNIRFAFLEVGAGWVPYWAWWMDENAEMPTRRKHLAEWLPHMKKRPSEYFKNGRCYFGFEPEEDDLSKVAKFVGEGQLIFGSDYPHATDIDWQGVRILRQRRDISDTLREKFFDQNPRKLYGLQ